MDKKGIIFTDIDGTLIFHTEIHGIREISKTKNDLVKVFDSLSSKEYLAHDVSTNLYKVFFEENTKKIVQQLKNDYHIVLVSGARKSTMDKRLPIINFADSYILENGGLILGKDYLVDSDWANKMEPEKNYLDAVKTQLESEGWNLDIEGRTTALRVRKKDNTNKSDYDFESLCENISLPFELKKTMNIGSLDIILNSAGKGNAVNYLTKKWGYSKSDTIGIGDDMNDIDLLNETGTKYVIGSAYEKVLEIAKNNNWNISKGAHFEGINEILTLINSNK